MHENKTKYNSYNISVLTFKIYITEVLKHIIDY